MNRPLILVSSCLLGEAVRYDGRHKRCKHIAGFLQRDFDFIPLCPEVGCGMTVPREAMRLEGNQSCPALVTVRSRKDKTLEMMDYCSRLLSELERENIGGLILKARSPSCGIRSAELYCGDSPIGRASGIFAAFIMNRFPDIPAADEEDMADPAFREKFVAKLLRNR